MVICTMISSISVRDRPWLRPAGTWKANFVDAAQHGEDRNDHDAAVAPRELVSRPEIAERPVVGDAPDFAEMLDKACHVFGSDR